MITADVNNGQAGHDAVWIQLILKKDVFFSIICWKIEGFSGIFRWFEEFPSLKMKIIWIMCLFIYDANSALPVYVTLPLQVWKTEQLADSQQMCANKTVHASFFLNFLVCVCVCAHSHYMRRSRCIFTVCITARTFWLVPHTAKVCLRYRVSLRLVWGLSQSLNSTSSCEWAANTSRAMVESSL